MPSDLPHLTAYPETIRGLSREPLRRLAPCFKCGASTAVAYQRRDTRRPPRPVGRAWPTCLACALDAARCPHCGDMTPRASSRWVVPEEGRHAAGYFETEHESGARCRAFEREATFTITCSSCATPIRFRLLVSANRIGSGVSKELRCEACGARWRVGDERRGCVVYVAPSASAA